MPKINWLDKLNDEQVVYADMIAQKAKELGVPPELAMAVAYHESGLNPRKIGGAKEIGIMQVLPSTGRGLGYTPGDLHDPAKNIEAGIKYLKSHLDTYGSPEIAAFAYNRGPNVANKFISGEDDQAGQNYVKSVQGLGGFSGKVQVEEPVPEFEAEMRAMQESAAPEAEQQAQKMAGLMGAGAGAAVGAKRAIGPVIAQKAGDVAQYLGKRSAMGQMAAQQGAVPPIAPLAGASAAPAAGAAPAVGATAAPLRATGPGSAVVNYARAFGLPEIEAQRALDMTKQEGGVHALTTQRREGLREIAERFPTERYVENPRFGGLMTPDYGPGGPPQTFVQQHAGGMAPIPKPAPIPVKSSGLEQVAQTFRGMMEPAGRLATRVLAPLGLYSTGAEGVAMAQELERPEPDYAAAAASGLGALGGVLSLFPPTAPVGVPMSIAGPMVREGVQQTKRRAIPARQMQQLMQQTPQPDMGAMVRSLGGTLPQ